MRIALYVIEKPLDTLGFIGGVFARVKISLTVLLRECEKLPNLPRRKLCVFFCIRGVVSTLDHFEEDETKAIKRERSRVFF